jgi:hypothetical protein
MRKSNQTILREALRKLHDGATASGLARQLGMQPSSALRALRGMPDVYIDRWERTKRGPVPFVAVFCAAHVPADCPRPEVRA